MNSPNVLFSRAGLTETLRSRRAAALDRVETWDGDELLRIPATEIAETVAGDYALQCPQLLRDQTEQVEVGESVQMGQGMFTGTAIVHKQTRLVIAVPFSGDALVFELTPPQFQTSMPYGTVVEDEVHLVWEGIGGQGEDVKLHFDNQIDTIEKWLSWSRPAIEAFTTELTPAIVGRVMQRRIKLQADRDLGVSIGYPLRRRPEAATTDSPEGAIPAPAAEAEGPGREPELDERTYEEILRVLRHQAVSLERAPSTTAKLDEEEIRNLLLAGLNAQPTIAGRATGETFNGRGKTDILVRVQNTNIFIGECKFWHGPAKWTETLDQLLGYLTWRDKNAALLLFMRDGTPSHIVPEAVKAIEAHPNHKKTLQSVDPAERADFIVHGNGDPNREIRLTQLPFHLPRAHPQAEQ